MEGGILSICLGKECIELEEMCGVWCVEGREGDVGEGDERML
jgi:hypothetical protein